MNEHELIAKQQLEIERLNIKIDNYMMAAALAREMARKERNTNNLSQPSPFPDVDTYVTYGTIENASDHTD